MGEIGRLLEDIRNAGEGDEVRVADVIGAAGEHSLIPALLVPALLVVTPLSGIPGLSSALGLTIALIAAQLLINRDHLWLPQWVMRRKFSRDKLGRALDWMERPVGFLDRITARRLTPLVRRPLTSVLELTCLCCGLAMPMLELVPFTSSILGAAVSIMAIALLTKDGLFALGALILIGVAAVTAYYLIV